MPRRFTLRQLEYFVAVGQAGSIAAASEAINVSSPSISAAIAQLRGRVRHPALRPPARAGAVADPGRPAVLRRGEAPARGGRRPARPRRRHRARRPRPDRHRLLRHAGAADPRLAAAQLRGRPPGRPGGAERGRPGAPARDAAPGRDRRRDHLRPRDPPGRRLRAARLAAAARDGRRGPPLRRAPFRADRGARRRADGAPRSAAQPRLLPLALRRRRPQAAHRRADPRHGGDARLVANGYGYALANLRLRTDRAPDGRPLSLVRLAGDPRPMALGIATMRSERRTRIVTAFEAHCRERIAGGALPGLAE